MADGFVVLFFAGLGVIILMCAGAVWESYRELREMDREREYIERGQTIDDVSSVVHYSPIHSEVRYCGETSGLDSNRLRLVNCLKCLEVRYGNGNKP